MVECFEAASNQCTLSRHCKLKAVLQQATNSYLAVLDAVTLADLATTEIIRVQMPVSAKIKSSPG